MEDYEKHPVALVAVCHYRLAIESMARILGEIGTEIEVRYQAADGNELQRTLEGQEIKDHKCFAANFATYCFRKTELDYQHVASSIDPIRFPEYAEPNAKRLEDYDTARYLAALAKVN